MITLLSKLIKVKINIISTNKFYRYGFNAGSEKDDEIFIGAYTAEYWEYDSRLGRRWNVDPVVNEGESPYASFHNSPNIFNDPDGATPGLIMGFIKGLFRSKDKREFAPRASGLWNRLKEAGNEAVRTAFNELKIIGGVFAVDTRRGAWGIAHQYISRFTFELPQTIYGLVYGVLKNLFGHIDDVMWVNGTTYLYEPNDNAPHMVGHVMVGKQSAAQDYYNDDWQGKAKISRTLGPLYFMYQMIDGYLNYKFGKMVNWEKRINVKLDNKFNHFINGRGNEIHNKQVRRRIRRTRRNTPINLIKMKGKHHD